MDEERLVIEVQNRSIIYDFSHPFYKDNVKKDVAWNEISESVGVDVELCKTKWRTLRDNFVKQRRKMSSCGSAGGPGKEWKFKDIMSFLVPYLQSKSSKINLGGVSGMELKVPLAAACGSDEQPSCSSEFRSRPPSAPSPSQPAAAAAAAAADRPRRSRSPRDRASPLQRPSETRRTAGASDVEARFPSVEAASPPPPRTVLDECHHFALSLVPLLNMMDFDRRQETKIHFLHYISNQLRQETGPGLHPPPHQGGSPRQLRSTGQSQKECR